jgi:hypothetical protein
MHSGLPSLLPEKRHPYPALAMTGIVTLFKNLAKFGFNGMGVIEA